MYSWNSTINDTSPILDFHPYSEGPLQFGWATAFDASASYFNTVYGEEADGSSLHITSFPGASVNLQFEGTAIYLYGSANCSYTVTLDNQNVNVPPQRPYGLLFYQEDLDPITHFVTLTAQPKANTTEQLSFSQAVFTSTIDQSATGLTELVVQNWNDTLQYQGSWTNGSGVANIPNKAHPGVFKQTQQPNASVSLNFTNGVAVAVHGSRNYGHYTYDVVLDGQKFSYNASTTWEIGDSLLFYHTGLDPDSDHTIQLINTGMQDYYKTTLNWFSVFSVNNTAGGASGPPPSEGSSTPSHKTSVGVIVGPVIAGVAVIAIALALFVYYRRRRPRGRDEDDEDSVSPFPKAPRPELWHKGMEAGMANMVTTLDTPQPHQGKRSRPAAVPASEPTEAGPSRSTPSVSGQAATSSSAPSEPRQATLPGTVSVDHIIEIIAERLNPIVRSAAHDEAPPQYQA
ncbi:hypothetical protein PsYK624_144960 [Phanerochaete sordida]|uniref:Transmembrane protein n=1 Tax=Phanerochaete sordida TaxID=48140 RepID=A0A9P3GMT4_9APHY|nr:hypothetical protein PsYK624_144960 [Phanerochaete sordida]